MNIGQNIYEMRKATNITQETLALAVGVSAQAVSKWESGGTPDIELLPRIADYFGVSIDALFGRTIEKCVDVEREISKALAVTDRKDVLHKAFDYCWAIEKGICGSIDYEATVADIASENRDYDGFIRSQMLFEEGFTSMAFNEDLRYFLVMPEPLSGWIDALGYKEIYADFFEFLGNRNIVKLLFILSERDNKPFTPRLVEKTLGVEESEAKVIIDSLISWKFLDASTIEFDDEVKTVYTFKPNPALIGLLTMVEELIDDHRVYYCYSGGRQRPYLSTTR